MSKQSQQFGESSESLTLDVDGYRLYFPKSLPGTAQPWRMAEEDWLEQVISANKERNLIQEMSLTLGIVKSDRESGLSHEVTNRDILLVALAMRKKIPADAFLAHQDFFRKALPITGEQIDALKLVQTRTEARKELVLDAVSMNRDDALLVWVARPDGGEMHPLCSIESGGRIGPSKPAPIQSIPQL